ncbi:MAG: hypothetical protein M1820_002968 [Bogoriella megaspora]|nr:MAG: hypothetical protein M1820_002968 [Bogoriella megaspora]
MELAMKIRRKIKEYQEAVLLESAFLSMRKPSKQLYKAFYNHFWNVENPKGSFPSLVRTSSFLYDDREELVALACPPQEDPLSGFLRKYLPDLFMAVFLLTEMFKLMRQQTHRRGSLGYFSAHRIAMVVWMVNMIPAVSFFYGAILSLYYARSDKVKLGLVAAHTVAFSLGVSLLTNARWSEVFGACAAYAAVLVVFVSGGLGNQQKAPD